MQSLVDALYTQYLPHSDGEVATYIPELSTANPDDFGVCLITADGQVFEAGDCDREFTIQSISKPFTFGMAIEELGHDVVLRHVGVEPRLQRVVEHAGQQIGWQLQWDAHLEEAGARCVPAGPDGVRCVPVGRSRLPWTGTGSERPEAGSMTWTCPVVPSTATNLPSGL